MDTSAEARVIACFTFIVSLLLRRGAIDNLLTGPSSLLPDSEFGRLVIALMPVAATVVAFQAGNAAQAAWARALGGAAVVLGVLTSIGGVLYFLANT